MFAIWTDVCAIWTDDRALAASEPSRTRAIVEQACVGKPACAVAADERVFGTPCAGTLNLAVTVACG